MQLPESGTDQSRELLVAYDSVSTRNTRKRAEPMLVYARLRTYRASSRQRMKQKWWLAV